MFFIACVLRYVGLDKMTSNVVLRLTRELPRCRLRMKQVDTLIVGQGLAGTAIAWHLYERGASFLVVDECASSTSSRVAAGLITPVTGQRAATCWEWSQASQDAERYYRKIEQYLGLTFLSHSISGAVVSE